MINPISHKLYLRIWLAVVGSILILSLVLAWAWHQFETAREQERQTAPPRAVTLRESHDRRVIEGQGTLRWAPERGTDLTVMLADGRALELHVAPHATTAESNGLARWWRWLRPPYGFLWIVALAGGVVMLGVFPIARRLTQRLERLQRSVQRWGEGRLDERAAVVGADEVTDLAQRFNQAADRIQELMGEQVRLLQSQKSLLANASHELRSPLARIRMALELSDHAAPATDVRQEISRNVTELDELVEEILLASRLDAARVDLGPMESVDLVGLLAEECARVDAELHLPPRTGEIPIAGVTKLLRRAIRNLLENAIRHGKRAGRSEAVQARLELADGWALVHIDDHGPGVPADQRERIFDPFYRLPGASEREGGVGLGLALVRSIAQHHDGTAICQAAAGGGARFSLRLPRPDSAPPRESPQKSASPESGN